MASRQGYTRKGLASYYLGSFETALTAYAQAITLVLTLTLTLTLAVDRHSNSTLRTSSSRSNNHARQDIVDLTDPSPPHPSG